MDADVVWVVVRTGQVKENSLYYKNCVSYPCT